ETRGRSTKDNIARQSHQRVANQETQHNSLPRPGGRGFSTALGESIDHLLHPMKVEVGDDRSKHQAEGDPPSVDAQGRGNRNGGQQHHNAGNATKRAGVKGSAGFLNRHHVAVQPWRSIRGCEMPAETIPYFSSRKSWSFRGNA